MNSSYKCIYPRTSKCFKDRRVVRPVTNLCAAVRAEAGSPVPRKRKERRKLFTPRSFLALSPRDPLTYNASSHFTQINPTPTDFENIAAVATASRA